VGRLGLGSEKKPRRVVGGREAGSAGETRNPSSTRAHFSALVSAFQLGGRVVELVSNSV
jgi:hypothetical protein